MRMIKSVILETVADSEKKLTPRELEKIILQRQPSERCNIKTAIRDLVSKGDLAYTYIYGCSFLERSFHKAVRISKKIILKPPEIFYRGEPGDARDPAPRVGDREGRHGRCVDAEGGGGGSDVRPGFRGADNGGRAWAGGEAGAGADAPG